MDDAHLVERRLSGEALFHGRLLHVFRDTVRLPDGSIGTREFVLHPGAVMVIALLDDATGQQRLVLERQFRYPVGRIMVEFPAGKIDPGESPWACARRELREETGYNARQWARAGVLHPVSAYSSEAIEIWFARGLRAGPRGLDPGEFLEVFSTTLDELLHCCRDGRVTDGKTLAAALWLQNLCSGAWDPAWQQDPDWPEDCGSAG